MARRPHILISESAGFSKVALEQLGEVATVEAADLDRDELLAKVPEADVLWIRLRHLIDAEILAAGARLRILASPTTGLNHIDLEAAARCEVEVVSLRGETAFLKDVRATAEHTVGLMLALLRNLPAAIDHARCGGWNRDLFRGAELHGRTVGILGYGRLGRLVAGYLVAFGARVIAYDPRAPDPAPPEGVTMVPFANLLQMASLLSVHVPLDSSTQSLLGRRQFGCLPAGSYLVNTSRGEVIAEEALIEALESGHLAGAALDVLAGERASGMEEHPLVKYAQNHTNLLLTPHIGGCTWESMRLTEEFLAGKVLDRLA